MKFLNREQEAAINSATDPEVIKALIHQAAENGGVQFTRRWEDAPTVNTVVTNGFARDTDPQRRERDPQGRFISASQPQQECKRVATIGGRELEFSAETPELLETLVAQARVVADALKPEETTASRVAQARREQEENDVRVMHQTELELKFKRGEISTQQYLEESGAIEEYMASHGAPMEAIVQTVHEAQAQQEAQSWSDAVETFLQSPAGASWPGGENNLEMMNLQIRSLGLEGAPDKGAALAQAYQSMKQKGMIFQPPTEVRAANELVALQEAMANTSSPEEIRQAMEEYKAAQGSDANEAFVKTFGRSGADTKYSPVVPSGERRSSGLFGR